MPSGDYDIDANPCTGCNAFDEPYTSTGNFDINCAGNNSHTRTGHDYLGTGRNAGHWFGCGYGVN